MSETCLLLQLQVICSIIAIEWKMPERSKNSLIASVLGRKFGWCNIHGLRSTDVNKMSQSQSYCISIYDSIGNVQSENSFRASFKPNIDG